MNMRVIRGLAALLSLAFAGAACGGAPPADDARAEAPPAAAARSFPALVEEQPFAATATLAVRGADTVPLTPAPPRPDRCRWADSVVNPALHTPGFGTGYEPGMLERGIALECALRPGGRRVRLVVGGEDGIPLSVDVHAPPDARTRVQRLPLDNSERAYRGSELVQGQDLNDDGWTDLKVQTYSGSGGILYDVFTWNPRTGRFEQDSVMPTASNVRPVDGRACVHTSRASGAFNVHGAEFCWSRGGWRLVRRWEWQAIDAPGSTLAVQTTEEMRNGRVVRVRVDTVPDSLGAVPPGPP